MEGELTSLVVIGVVEPQKSYVTTTWSDNNIVSIDFLGWTIREDGTETAGASGSGSRVQDPVQGDCQVGSKSHASKGCIVGALVFGDRISRTGLGYEPGRSGSTWVCPMTGSKVVDMHH